jgi:nicotinate phosphoribosyltransferase
MDASLLGRTSTLLYTDFYQLTMAQLYFRHGLHTRPVQFDYFYRSNPDYGSHQAGFCIFAGLEWLVGWMEKARFDQQALVYLRRHQGSTGKRLFSVKFLDWLADNGDFQAISMRALAEGRVVHPGAPLVTVCGEIGKAQILESALLNHLNYATLIATKAARIKEAGAGGTVIEFGMRRAHHTAADAGARAALIGGVDFTSNTGISYRLGYPPKGTHAHSMVQLFMALGEGELGAFRAYADIYPDDCLLLVDTVNTLESGIPNAIRVFEELQRRGHQPVGIRLDSGDLAYLSVRAAKMLNDAGFSDTVIVLSNKIDEMVLLQILQQIQVEAPRYGVDPDALIKRLVYGVGTRLITSGGCGALDGVYKMTGVETNRQWVPTTKISDSPDKRLIPGKKQVWRVYGADGMATADLIGLDTESPGDTDTLILHHPHKQNICRTLQGKEIQVLEPLLIDILRNGRCVYDFPPLETLRAYRDKDIGKLDPGVKRLINPHIYHVSLTDKLWRLKQDVMRKQMGKSM